MKYSIRKNWVTSFEMILKHPALLLPFIFIAFLETIALEIIYFSTRFPLSAIAAPIIRKFFGAPYLRYPAHLMLVPDLFYYAQVVIYIFAGVLLTAIAVNMFRNMKEKLPVKTNVMARNALKRYGAYLVYGIMMILLLAAIKPMDSFVFTKALRLAQRIMPGIPGDIGRAGFTIFLFFTNFILQALLIASIPYMVLEKKPLFKAILSSLVLFSRNMFAIIGLTALPFLAYLPIVALKGVTGQLIDSTFPEIVLIVTFAGSIIAVFVDSFMTVCICRLLTDKAKTQGRA